MYKHVACWVLLILSQVCFADARSYQTAPKLPVSENPQSITVPLISVNPNTGQTRVFITPEGEFGSGLASHKAPVYHARALYEATPAGVSASTTVLHQQMGKRCPQGWIKLQEWASLQSKIPELHYQFQCLDDLPQD